MSGKRELGISYGPTVLLNDVNDAVCGGATNQGTGQSLYGGQLGIEIGFTNAQIYSDPAVGTLYGGVYKYVQTYLSSTNSPARGYAAFWYNADAMIVTPDFQNGLACGVFINPITKGNYGWIQVGGKASVMFRQTITKATPAVGDLVVVQSQYGVADILADVTGLTSGGATGDQLALGIVTTGSTFTATAWSSTTTYAAGAVVSYGGVNYTALIASLNVTPGTSATTWQVGTLTLVQLLERFCTPFA
jgi:hypothetical protein